MTEVVSKTKRFYSLSFHVGDGHNPAKRNTHNPTKIYKQKHLENSIFVLSTPICIILQKN